MSCAQVGLILVNMGRIWGSSKPAGKGTGLGLAVSRHLLSQFDGSLDAGDRPGGGARFTIRLAGP